MKKRLLSDPVSHTFEYTFECKVCGAWCLSADGAYDHYRQHAVDSTFTKTLTGPPEPYNPLSEHCEIIGCHIPPQYVHKICTMILCPKHVVRHQRCCTFKQKEAA